MLVATNLDTELTIASVAAILAAASLCFSIFTFIRQRKSQKYLATRDFKEGWQAINQIIIDDDDLLEIECENHPYGKLSQKEMKKAYLYFLRFNVIHRAFLGSKIGEIHKEAIDVSINNSVNISFNDREFIQEHVFCRGYEHDFKQQYIEKWNVIETTGRPISMPGDHRDESISNTRESK